MKTALIIVSIVAAIGIGVAIYFGMKAKKATAANNVLDPNGVVTPAVVAAASSPAVEPTLSSVSATNADIVAARIMARRS